MALADTAELAVRISLKDNLSSGLGKINRNLGTFDSGIGRVGRGVGKLGKAFGTAGLLAGGAVVAGLAGAAKAAIDYEDAFAGVIKTVDSQELAAAGLTFENLSDSIRKMSREMPNTAIELAGIAEAAGALGIKAGDIEAFTKQVAILAATTDVSAEDAATALGQLQNVIGLTGDEFDNFAAALVDLGNKGASTESQILEVARRSGAAAKLIGVAKDETLGWAAAAANLGLQPELAGTSLQRFYIQTQNIVSDGGKALEKFAKIAGTSAKDFKKAFDKDASGAMEDFLEGLGKLPKDQRIAAVQNLFGKGTGLTRLILGLSDSIDQNLTPSLDTSTQAWKDATAASAEFEKRNATVKSAFARLKNNVLDAAVTIGEGFAPALGRAADKLSAFLAQDKNRNKLKEIGREIGKAIDGIDFDRLLKTAQGVASALKPALAVIVKLADLISKLPPELLGAGGALVLTNKVTGGLVISGLADIFGGLGTSLARSLAASIPLFGRAFVQPVFVTNMGAGLPGGGGAPPGGAGLKGLLGVGAGAATALTVGIVLNEISGSATNAMTSAMGQANTPLATKLHEMSQHLSPLQSMAHTLTNLDKIPDQFQRFADFLGGKTDGMGNRVVDSVAALRMDTKAEQIATRNANQAGLAGVRQKQQESLIAFRAGERATQTGNSLQRTANANLVAIKAKKSIFTAKTFVNVSTRVSVSEFQRQARYTSRVARSTSLSAQ